MALADPLLYEEVSETLVREQVSLWRDGWRRLRRNKLALIAAVFLALLVVVSVVAFFWTPYDPNAVGLADDFAKPGNGHIFGADELGRDLLSRLMKGAQVSLGIGICSSLAVLAIGIVVGLAAGYFRGWVDAALSFVINAFYGVPPFLIAAVFYVLFHGGFFNVVFAVALTVWMDMARLVRGQTLAIREREYIEAARGSGARSMKILFGHILPNSLGPVIVQATFVIPGAIIFEAFLSFLGLGIQPPAASWGSMLSEGVQALSYAPHMTIIPAVALSLTLLAFNFFGDGLRDAFDPRQKR